MRTVVFLLNKNIKIIWDNLPKDWVRMIKLALEVDRKPSKEKKDNMSALEKIGEWGIEQWQSMVSVGVFLRDATAALGRFLMGKSVMRRIDFDLALEDCGYKAVSIFKTLKPIIDDLAKNNLRLECVTQKDFEPANRLAKMLGFSYEGTMKKYYNGIDFNKYSSLNCNILYALSLILLAILVCVESLMNLFTSPSIMGTA